MAHAEASVKQWQMMMAAAIVATAGLWSTPAAAQGSATPTIDLGVGYQYLAGTDDQTYPVGVNVDVTGAFLLGLRWVGEVGFARDRATDNQADVTATLMAVNYGGGLRLAPGRGRWPYVQVIVGQHRDSYTLNAEGIGDLITTSQSTLMVQPGVGLGFNVGRLRVFGQADYRRIYYEAGEENNYRAVVGLRFRLR